MNYIVYRHFDKNGLLLYVGFTSNIMARTAAHMCTKDWHKEIHNITLEHFTDKLTALNAELKYQLEEKPKYVFPRSDGKQTRENNYIDTFLRFSTDWKLTVADSYVKKAIKLGLIETKKGDSKEWPYCDYFRLNPLRIEEIQTLTKGKLKADVITA